MDGISGACRALRSGESALIRVQHISRSSEGSHHEMWCEISCNSGSCDKPRGDAVWRAVSRASEEGRRRVGKKDPAKLLQPPPGEGGTLPLVGHCPA